jgi:hypothetical protein
MIARKIHVIVLCIAVLGLVPVGTAQVLVRHTEGLVHGFLVVRTPEGEAIAHGDLTQGTHGGTVTSHLVFHFKDGSLHDETAAYSQRRIFRLLRYHLIQKGPAFSRPTNLSLDTSSGQVTVRYSDEDGKEQVKAEHMTLPPDLANGMIFTLIKNVPSGSAKTSASLLVATPKPRLVKLWISEEGEDSFRQGSEKRTARHYVVRLELRGLTGVIAKVIGNEPPDIHAWILGGEAPSFLKSRGPLYAGGPTWIVELESPTWPRDDDEKK